MEEGDSILSISNKANLPAEELLAANPGVVTVRPGQVINIPRPPLAPIQSYEQTAVGNRSGYGLPNSTAVSTSNQYGVGVPNKSMFRQAGMGTQSGAFAGTGSNSIYRGGRELNVPASGTSLSGSPGGRRPRTGGGYMPSLAPVQNPFAGAQARVGVGTVGGQPNLGNYNTAYNGFQTPPMTGQAPSPYAGYTGTAGYGMQGTPMQYNFQTPPMTGQVPQQPYLGASSYLNPVLQPQPKEGTTGASTQQPAAMFPADEKGRPLPYTGNPDDPNTALWKKYWDDSARAGVDLAGRTGAPSVMTRDQIWEMKAAQRRRQAVSREEDGYSEDYGAYQYETTDYGANAPLVRNITWSIRG